MLAEAKTKDGRYISAYFETRAKTWRGICKAARNALIVNSFFDKGTTVCNDDIAILRVNGNAE